jgi:hypothetical protein
MRLPSGHGPTTLNGAHFHPYENKVREMPAVRGTCFKGVCCLK